MDQRVLNMLDTLQRQASAALGSTADINHTNLAQRKR